jgi:hypothetical protein
MVKAMVKGKERPTDSARETEWGYPFALKRNPAADRRQQAERRERKTERR